MQRTPSDHSRSRRRLGPVLAVAFVCAGLAVAVGGGGGSIAPAPALAASTGTPLLSIFSADTQLRQNPLKTLQTLKSLGVQAVRTSFYWANVTSSYAYADKKPSQLKATDPASYPATGWKTYDAIDRAAAQTGIRLFVTIAGPIPVWAAGAGKGSQTAAKGITWKPSAAQFGDFVRAVGTRYNGKYKPPGQSKPLPRISFWSIWNEPNYGSTQGLTPQVAGGQPVAPSLYRGLVNAAWSGLQATGHKPSSDTILIGETAPYGNAPAKVGVKQPVPEMAPLAFIRALYCVGSNLKPLTGGSATKIGCPSSASKFKASNPGLFNASGWAVHPYTAGQAPTVQTKGSADYTEFSRLSQLGNTLDKAAKAYGSSAKLAIYSTEFGFQTNPPNTGQFATSMKNAVTYMNQAEYLSWRNSRIRSYMQYLLVDPNANKNGNYSTGLKFFGGAKNLFGGKAKPTFNAYRMPLWLPKTKGTKKGSLEVWGCARAAPLAPKSQQKIQIQFAAPRANYKTVKTVTPGKRGCYFDTTVRFGKSGNVRLAWKGQYSRTQAISIR